MSSMKKIPEGTSYPCEYATKYQEFKLERVKEVDSLGSLSKYQSSEKVEGIGKSKRSSATKTNENALITEKSHFNFNGHLPHKESKELKKKASNALCSSGKTKLENRPTPDGIYALPSWVRERPFLSWGFVSEPIPGFTKSGPIGVLPPNVQESRLIDDILFCLVGVDGDYVQAKKSCNAASAYDKLEFTLDESANESLKLLVQKMFPMFTFYSTIINSAEENLHYERGLVNHAFGAAIHTFLKDYYVLVSQLEKQHIQRQLTLQKLWFYLQPTLTTFETLAGIISELNKGNCFGGNVLSLLHENTASLTGSSKSAEICHFITRAATVPYFELLEKWIYKGIISDYYSEFLVQDNKLVENEQLPSEFSNTYWEKRYTLRQDQIPIFLNKSADMILRTGKYLNVVRQCGKTVNYPDAKSLVYTMRESQYVEFIKPAYHFASVKLLDLLMDDLDLKGRLLSVKHYFLLDQGDFIVQFMDMAEEELQKDIDDVVLPSLESLLELALRTSVVNEDKYKDDLSFELLSMDFLSQLFKILQMTSDEPNDHSTEPKMLTGLEAFVFNYSVKWPLSLVINGKAIAYYQILFRHLFYCKHIENMLGRLWHMNKRIKPLPRTEMYHYVSAFSLRQRMLNFVQNLDYYLTLEVIEPHWNDFFKKIGQVTNVDELLFCHSDFLEKCIVDCMLTNSDFLRVLASLMKLCAEFSSFLQNMLNSNEDETSVFGDSMLFSLNERPFPELSNCPATLEHFKQQISTFEKKFDESIVRMLRILHDSSSQSKQTAKVISMLYRLDFSKFYEEETHVDSEQTDVFTSHFICK